MDDGGNIAGLVNQEDKSGLRDLSTSKTPEASVSVALTREEAWEEIENVGIKWSTELGRSRKRNVVCKEVEMRMSQKFRRNCKGKGDAVWEQEGGFSGSDYIKQRSSLCV